jgi:hypothetical protein
MLQKLKRHLLPIVAHFDEVFVLTYALPEAVLKPLLPTGLTLDTYEGNGFLAVALVRTRKLRPAGLPEFMGRDFILSGYRIFTRLKTNDGRSLRGLKILRSDADSEAMVFWGNRLTRYGYEKADISWVSNDSSIYIGVRTASGVGDLDVSVDLSQSPAPLPPGSPFRDIQTALKYSGPLPYTFSAEPESGSIVVVKGVRHDWRPVAVSAQVSRCAFLEQKSFSGAKPILANAFHMRNIPYRWEPGVLEKPAAA